MTQPHYLPDYNKLIDALNNPDRFDPLDRVNALKIALGEVGDIWPETIKIDEDNQRHAMRRFMASTLECV